MSYISIVILNESLKSGYFRDEKSSKARLLNPRLSCRPPETEVEKRQMSTITPTKCYVAVQCSNVGFPPTRCARLARVNLIVGQQDDFSMQHGGKTRR